DVMLEALRAQPAFRWLDEGTGWFWLEDVPRNRLRNQIDKILSVSPQVEISALRAGIARNYRMQGFSPPTRVLRAFCEQLPDCEVVAGRVVVDKRPRVQQDELSPTEQTMLQVFRESGPLLSYSNARERCIQAGV